MQPATDTPEPDINQRFNDGLVPAPELDADPAPLSPPAWMPAEEELARAQRLSIQIGGVLILLTLACLAVAYFSTWGAR